jgi:hypothetical protein
MAFLRTSWCSAGNAETRCTRNALGNVRCSLCLSSINTEPWSRFTGRRCAAQLTCVWCRAEWPSGAKSGAGASPTSGGYVNLGSAAGISGQRDTSSCAPMMFILLPCPLMTPLPLDHQSWRYGGSRNRTSRA